jgi:hypothetical protein
VFHIANENSIAIHVFPPQERDFFLSPFENKAKATIFRIGMEEGR